MAGQIVPLLRGKQVSILVGPAALVKGVQSHLRYDVRHWPNPHHDAVLGPLTGAHPEVQRWLIGKGRVARELLDMAGEVQDELKDKAWVSVGLYCHGGRHRSLMAAWGIGQVLAWSDVRSVIWRLVDSAAPSSVVPMVEAHWHASVQPGSFVVPTLSEAESEALGQVMASASWLKPKEEQGNGPAGGNAGGGHGAEGAGVLEDTKP